LTQTKVIAKNGSARSVRVNTAREIGIGLLLGTIAGLGWRAYHEAWRETIDNYYKGLEAAR